MKNRLLMYRDDLNYPEWMSEYEDEVRELFESCKDDPDFPEVTNFQAFSIEIYLGTSHAQKLAEKAPPPDSEYWDGETWE